MKVLTAGLAVLLLLGAGTAWADRWTSGKRLPKPIDWPIVRGKIKESHKPGNRAKHPPQATASLQAPIAAIARA